MCATALTHCGYCHRILIAPTQAINLLRLAIFEEPLMVLDQDVLNTDVNGGELESVTTQFLQLDEVLNVTR